MEIETYSGYTHMRYWSYSRNFRLLKMEIETLIVPHSILPLPYCRNFRLLKMEIETCSIYKAGNCRALVEILGS